MTTILTEVLVPSGDHCGESPLWSSAENALYWTDINRFLIHRLEIDGRRVTTYQFTEPCTALFPTRQAGHFLVALASGIVTWSPGTHGAEERIHEFPDWPQCRLNDGAAGPAGEIWVGSMANNVATDGTPGPVESDDGKLLCITKDETRVVETGIGISNTVCFSPDNQFMYFGDTRKNTIWKYDYDSQTSQISNKKVFFADFERGVPDGSTVDCEGHLWNCRYGGGCIVRINPLGEIVDVLEMPCTNITNCEFGGKDLDTLFVTTASLDIDRYEQFAGSLFALTPGAKGNLPRTADL